LCLRGRDREGEREKRQDERKGRRKNINQLTKNISTSIEIGGRRIEVGIFYGVRAWVGTKELTGNSGKSKSQKGISRLAINVKKV